VDKTILKAVGENDEECIFSTLALCLVLFAGQASAYFTWGMGSQTCNLFISAKAEYEHARDQRTHLAHLNWIKGFITGINWSRESDIARDLSIETVDQWIDTYCRANLDASIGEASAALVVDLEKQSKPQ
jgi:hypothetical protein